ncbi:MAG: DUF1801 domain-containing protein [Flavobacteriales bacterium]
MNPKVDWYFTKAGKWQEATEKLRGIALDSQLTEELKWGCPCYTLKKTNVFLIHVFKDYCALLFMKGALLKDDHGILVQQTKNVQAARQIRFTSLQQIVKQERIVKAYIQEAIAMEKAGVRVALKPTAAFEVPEEFQSKVDKMPALRKAFHALTPGRQRGYLLYFSSAKQAKTREARVEKNIERIMEGVGLDD